MSFKSDVVEIGSDAAGQSNGRPDASSHDHSVARRDNNRLALSWLSEAFLHTDDRYGRIAAGSPRSGVGILGLRLLEHHINLVPTMRHGAAVPMFDHSAGSPRYIGWRQKVATWPLSKQEAMNNRTFAV
ncbi:hypothetical protein ColTof4_05946 [Colletotrichum tofieldiae]|uniref:Uncharacterized protein n=1 Tax=Colletotrichum tofieldiae TaxID=708197 RepID=A0A166NW65_9PEZI|nr:hypothetical protein CT0861_05093 [Colletotrichum tofieldiae]GKT53783.1 hypothetical protein ColTof3_01122 [Colletotrichum tofieldiae]GKT73523.1 hypothetical protein ColTof4_05946 [Colletotrichum tofieldiae]GKT95464.1 hypothetical protein Ct61P_13314 [Colletotrichum tofieldiae]